MTRGCFRLQSRCGFSLFCIIAPSFAEWLGIHTCLYHTVSYNIIDFLRGPRFPLNFEQVKSLYTIIEYLRSVKQWYNIIIKTLFNISQHWGNPLTRYWSTSIALESEDSKATKLLFSNFNNLNLEGSQLVTLTCD